MIEKADLIPIETYRKELRIRDACRGKNGEAWTLCRPLKFVVVIKRKSLPRETLIAAAILL